MSSFLHKSNWLKQNYDKLIVVVVLLLLLGSALFLVLQVREKSSEPLAQARANASFAVAEKVNVTNLEQQLVLADNPQLMEPGRGVMGNELRVRCINPPCSKPIPYSAAVCPFCGTKQPEVVDPLTVSSARDGIPDVWKKKFGFDILDPNVANADPDNDGFTNLEEYRAGTEPLNPKSHPDIASKLRIWEIQRHRFKLRFMGMMQMPSGTAFQLNLRSGRTVFVKVGEEAENYKLTACETNETQSSATGKTTKEEVLVLTKDAETLRLVKGKDLQQFEMSVVLISLLDQQRSHPLTIRQTLKIHGNEYKIVDIKPDAVTIHDLQSVRETIVPPLTVAEREEISRVGAAKSESKPLERGAAQAPAIR